MASKLEGILLVNKPSGITSHDVVDIVRKKLGIKKVGHAGTLDPLAHGLLIILVGRATKLFVRFAEFPKEYKGVLRLGIVTSSGDSQGQVLKKASYDHIDPSDVIKAFNNFSGEIEQIPPMFSAVRVQGKRLYELARQGVCVERKPRKVVIYRSEVQKIELPYVTFYVKCSKGTYIRSLAEDVGNFLKCGAHITEIIRIAIGPFKLAEAIELDNVSIDNLRPL